ncbi:unnamed protein product (macronuclear) [Paramecium tetraurelia]|uniref:Uncharacterized protein n=1 Tax=Paramecium tetraurelia TaxID=5888 RepID=A0D0L8_PARTE|nr:uncharacterized protein GSPATT00012137001 [Paramecium tetraurelia]CAK76585.1 unnamed protein product [Paramecium tetraurelia]|eukprot:XP_001443982.1 hypothetical protein (macronuclear) [Paramecium tetraurelia strain d4-2]
MQVEFELKNILYCQCSKVMNLMHFQEYIRDQTLECFLLFPSSCDQSRIQSNLIFDQRRYKQ